jgi:hypothetical protein
MKKLVMAVTTIVAILASAPAIASTYDVSFTNYPGVGSAPGLGNVLGTATFEVEGLTDNTTGNATDVLLIGAPVALEVPSSLPFDFFTSGVVFDNTFTVTGGVITAADFEWTSTSGVGWSANLVSSLPEGAPYGTGSFDIHVNIPPEPAEGQILECYGPNCLTTLTSTTPLPAALPLFAAGLGALGLVARRRKRKVLHSQSPDQNA